MSDFSEKINEIKENPTRYIKSIAMDIVVVIVAVAYLFYQMVRLEVTDTNPLILLAQAFMGIVCGIIIKQSLGENGFSRGYNSDFWKREEDKYNDACSLAVDYTERVDNFYLSLEKEKRENYRRAHLQATRLKYAMWFNSDGDYIGDLEEYKKLTLHQKLVLKKCIRVKIYVLNLFSEYSTSSEQDTKKEMTDRRQRGRNFTKNTLAATLIAIIGVYFIPVLNGWSWAAFISSCMQVSLWILFGILQLYQNYNFIVQDKVATLRKKKELISRFVEGSKKGLYLEPPYKKQNPDPIVEQSQTIETSEPLETSPQSDEIKSIE